MNYQEALLRNLENYVIEKLREEDLSINHFTIELEVLQQLIDEKSEQESRKYKLIVGSEWECIVSCFANDSMFYKVGTKVKVLSLEEYDRVFFVRVKSEWQEVIFVVDQFLLCFKPLKKEE